jgi:hypothetical protein
MNRSSYKTASLYNSLTTGTHIGHLAIHSMGKKSGKRSKKASLQANEEKRSASHRSELHEPLPDAATVRPPKVLNPFYIESNALGEEEEEEHVGLLEYSNNMGDWNDDEAEYDINPYTRPYRHHPAQQQQRNQFYFEWKLRMGIIVGVMILVTWIILSLVHQNSPRASTISPTASPVMNTDPPTIAPVVTMQPLSRTASPTWSPEKHRGGDGVTERPIPSALPTFVNHANDRVTEQNATHDG